MKPPTQLKRIRTLLLLIAASLMIGRAYAIDVSPDPVLYWSNEARKAILPPSAGAENYGHKAPAEAAVYMGIAHVAIYDAAVVLEGGYEAISGDQHGPTADYARCLPCWPGLADRETVNFPSPGSGSIT